MTRLAYLDCVGGIAGDMLLAALLDAGAQRGLLEELPSRLGLKGVTVDVEPVARHSIGALAVRIGTSDHATERSWADIRELLEGANLKQTVRECALAVFERLAHAEARVHRVNVDSVHFHEVGGVDAMMDVCGTAVLLDDLGIGTVACSPLPFASGAIHSAHGMLPLPAPATAELSIGFPVTGVGGDSELVTPTGAALATTLAKHWGPLPPLVPERIGYGAGARDTHERPNLLRVFVGSASARAPTANVALLETNLDDMSPELVPDAARECFAAGALDVWTVPAQMKMGRPGIVFSALARPGDEPDVAAAMLRQTSALGVRVSRMNRYELEREQRTVAVGDGQVRVKIGVLDGCVVNVAPEHADCAALAARTNVPVKSVWAAALAAAIEP